MNVSIAERKKTMSDLISRQAVKEQACMFFGHEVIFANKIDLMPSAESREYGVLCALADRECPFQGKEFAWCLTCPHISEEDRELVRKAVEGSEQKTGEWTTEQVAEMLTNLFGDECACNFNDIDEWLPLACKYADTQCPHPKEKHGCWMQFLIQGGGTGE